MHDIGSLSKGDTQQRCSISWLLYSFAFKNEGLSVRSFNFLTFDNSRIGFETVCQM